MLDRAARDDPTKIAIISRTASTSYAELDEVSTRIAGALRRRGVEKGMRVAIYASKSIQEVAVIFAVAKAGGVLVHINPAFRDEQLQHVLQETEPAALFFHPSKAAAIARAIDGGGRPPCLIALSGPAGTRLLPPCETLEALIATAGPVANGAASENDLAAIIYTSGTTSRAKGIKVTHGILSQSTTVSADVLQNGPGDRLISLTPFSFDGALSQLFTATLVNATLFLQDSQFPKDVIHTLLTQKITGFHAVPSFWLMTLERYPAFAEYHFPHLRYLSLIGEVFPEDALFRLKDILAQTGFYMMYGTTEAFRSTCLLPEDFTRKKGSAGKPLPGVKIAIVGADGTPLKPGQTGEIVHSGAFVSPGYWHRDGDATFREDGVHTGDLGRLDEEGYLYFAGRKDTMIKRLGYQVYPEEIEACLTKLDGVALAAVACAPGCANPLIRAFITRQPGSALTADDVTEHCRRHLPHYMRPDEVVFRVEMPTTGPNKIDRVQLSRSP